MAFASERILARDLRHKITVGKRTLGTQDSYGQQAITYPTLGTFWADISALQGRELEAVTQRWAEAQFRVRMHYNKYGIDRADRIVWGTRVLDILDVEDQYGDQRWLTMYCREFTE